MGIKTILRDVDQKERLFLIITAVALIIITSLPFLFGYLFKPANTYFLAMPALNRSDYPNYFSYIEQAKLGHLLFQDLYTTEPQPRIILNLFFLGLGFIAKIFHLSALSVFHLSRIVLIPVFLFVVYLFISLLFREKQKRKICLIFICFSSGLSFWFLPWISNLSPLKQPMDLWIPEAITFLSLYTNPLFIFSLTLITLIFFLALLSLMSKNYDGYAIMAGLAGLFLFQAHPYHIPTIFLILFIFGLILFFTEKKINWQFLKFLLIFTLISSPSLFYYWWLSSIHWLTSERVTQAIPVGFTPGWSSLLISYGLLWPLVLVALFNFLKEKITKNYLHLFLISWLFSQIFLIYSPLPLQRRMSEGLHLVISILATFGLFFLYQKFKEKNVKQKYELWLKNKFLWIIIFIFFFTFSNIYILSRDIIYFKHPYFSPPKEIIKGMGWLKKNSSEEVIILATADVDTGNLIPAFAVRKVYAGHGVETAYFEKKYKEIAWFFGNNNQDEGKQAFLKKNKIDYIFFYAAENNSFQPEEKDYLKKVFEDGTVNIYKIKN